MTEMPLEHWSLEARSRFASDAARDRDAERLWVVVGAYLRRERAREPACSPHTRRAYRRAVDELVVLWPDVDLLSADARAAQRYVASLTGVDRGPIVHEDRTGRRGRRPKRGPLSPATIALRVAAARALFAALRWSGATDADPFAQPSTWPSIDQASLRAVSYSEYEFIELLGRATEDDDRLVLLLGAHAGLRVSEMLALRWDAVDLAARTLVVPGDGTPVALSPALVAALAARRARRATPANRVLGLRSQYGIYRRLRRLCERADVRFKGVRGLRHLAGARIVRAGGDVDAVQRLLRLGSRSSARRYAGVDPAPEGADET